MLWLLSPKGLRGIFLRLRAVVLPSSHGCWLVSVGPVPAQAVEHGTSLIAICTMHRHSLLPVQKCTESWAGAGALLKVLAQHFEAVLRYMLDNNGWLCEWLRSRIHKNLPDKTLELTSELNRPGFCGGSNL